MQTPFFRVHCPAEGPLPLNFRAPQLADGQRACLEKTASVPGSQGESNDRVREGSVILCCAGAGSSFCAAALEIDADDLLIVASKQATTGKGRM